MMRALQFLFAASLPICALAQAGNLDSTFDADGIAVAAVSAENDIGAAITVDPSGRIIVVGSTDNGSNDDIAVLYFLPDGSLDGSIGTGGVVTTAVGIGDDVPNAVVRQPDGRLLVAGSAKELAAGTTDMMLVRYDPDGTLDHSFDFDGKVFTPMGPLSDVATAVALRADGRIVVAGYSHNGAEFDFALARYNPDGSLDNSFNYDGRVTVEMGVTNDYVNAMALGSDGKILVAGYCANGSSNDFALARFTEDGFLDTTFGVDGRVITTVGPGDDRVYSIVIQPDQKILVGGYSYNGSDQDFAIARYLADGSLDNTFSSDGIATLDIGGVGNPAYTLLWQPDHRFLVAGCVSSGTSSDVALARFNSDGTPDALFGVDGVVRTTIGPTYSVGYGTALDAQGNILVTGYTTTPAGKDVVVLRYLSGMNVGVLEFEEQSSSMLFYPNPIADQATMEYELPVPANLTCELFDAQGRSVRTPLSNAHRTAGPHSETLDLSGLASGHYTVVLSNGRSKVSVQVVKQ